MVDRRRFLRTGAVGLAGMGVAAEAAGPQPGQASAVARPRTVLRRTLGRTGLSLPVVSMGVMNADNPSLVRAALDGGIVHFDTAHVYQRGRNEEMLGSVFEGVKRDSLVVATKVPPPGMDRSTGLPGADTKPEAFEGTFHLSLQRLRMDHVDILYVHGLARREAVLFEPLLEVLQRLKKAGKARFVGVSTHTNEPEVIRAAIESKVHDVVLTSYNFRQDHGAEVLAACREARKAGVGIVAMKTQAGGRPAPGRTAAVDQKAALRWALQDESVATAIPGFTTFEQLAEDLAVMADLRLGESERKALEAEARTVGLYCQQCGTCLPQCPRRLPIPDLMRGYMYAAGYRNLAQARDLAEDLGLPAAPCSSCSSCSVGCVQGFDVRGRVEDLLRLRHTPAAFLA